MKLLYPKSKTITENMLTGRDMLELSCVLDKSLVPTCKVVQAVGTAPKDIVACGYLSSANRFLVYSNGYVYSSLTAQSFMQLVALNASTPFTIEQYSDGQTQAIMVGNVTAVLHTGQYQTSRQFAGNLKCGVMHYGRLFGIDKTDSHTLRWSGEGGAFDWETGGYLLLKRGIGGATAVLKLEKRLVVLRECGLNEITAFGNYENYVQGEPIGCDRVIENSGGVIFDKLYFFTESGFKSYCDGKISAVDTLYADGVTSVKSSICWGQWYICNCNHSKFGKILFVFDVLRERCFLIEADVENMCVGDGVTLFCDGKVYKMEKSDYTFKNSTDFGTENVKVLKSVILSGNGKYDLEISNGKVARTFHGVNGKIKLSMTGREFYFTLKGSEQLDGFEVSAEVVDGL